MVSAVKVGGTWRTIVTAYVRVGGVWKTVPTIKLKVGGVWKDAKIVQDITVSANWGSSIGAFQRTSTLQTMAVPAGSTGVAAITFNVLAGSPTVLYSLAGGAFTAFSSGQLLTIANGNTLRFRMTGGTGDIIQLYAADNVTGAGIGDWYAEIT